MKLPVCYYGAGATLEDVKRDLRGMYSDIRKLTERSIDGFNLSPNLLGDGLEFTSFSPSVAGKITTTITNTSNGTYIRRKGDGASPENFYGMEIIVDTSSSTIGQFCIVDKDYLDQQLIELDPDDPGTIADPGGTIRTPYGPLTLDTGGAFNQIFKRNDVTQLTLDGTNVVSNDRHLIATTTNTADIGTSSIGWKELYIRTIDTDGANNLVLQRNNVTQLTFDGTSIINNDRVLRATTTFTADLGTSSIGWKELYIRVIDTDGDTSLEIQRNNSAVIDITSAGIDVFDDIFPEETNVYDIGTSSLAFKEIYTRTIDTDGANNLALQSNNVTMLSINADGSVDLDPSTDGAVNFKYAGNAKDTNLAIPGNTPTGISGTQTEWLKIMVNGNTRYIPVWG